MDTNNNRKNRRTIRNVFKGIPLKTFPYSQKLCQLSDKRPIIYIVSGVNAGALHYHFTGRGNFIIQVASQFNYLESPVYGLIVPVSQYTQDYSQGPIISAEAVIESIQRKINYMTQKLGSMLPDFRDVIHNGYMKLYDINQDKLEELYKRKIELNMLAQRVICESSDAEQIQIFCAAPSFQDYYGEVEYDSLVGKLCSDILVPQYQACYDVARKVSERNPDSPVYLHLTQVGQGAFRNPKEIMLDCIYGILGRLNSKNSNITIFIHAYNNVEELTKILQPLVDNSLIRLSVISEQLFWSLKEEDRIINFENITFEEFSESLLKFDQYMRENIHFSKIN